MSHHLIFTVLCIYALVVPLVIAKHSRESSSSEEDDSGEQHMNKHPWGRQNHPGHHHHHPGHHHHHSGHHHNPRFHHHNCGHHHHHGPNDEQPNKSTTTTATPAIEGTDDHTEIGGGVDLRSFKAGGPNVEQVDLTTTGQEPINTDKLVAEVGNGEIEQPTARPTQNLEQNELTTGLTDQPVSGQTNEINGELDQPTATPAQNLDQQNQLVFGFTDQLVSGQTNEITLAATHEPTNEQANEDVVSS